MQKWNVWRKVCFVLIESFWMKLTVRFWSKEFEKWLLEFIRMNFMCCCIICRCWPLNITIAKCFYVDWTIEWTYNCMFYWKTECTLWKKWKCWIEIFSGFTGLIYIYTWSNVPKDRLKYAYRQNPIKMVVRTAKLLKLRICDF